MKINEEKWYAGIDLHKNYTHVTIMDKHGYIQKAGRYENRENTLIPMLLACNTPVEAVVESTYGWYWLGDKLEEANIDYFLAHPKKVNAIAGKKKTDEVDSKILANLLRVNLLPMSYIPTKEERSLKELLRFRSQLVNQTSTVKRRLRDILAKQNLDCPYSDITGVRSREWFEDHLKRNVLSYPYNDETETLLIHASQLKKHISKYNDKVKDHAGKNESVQILKSTPGIGDVLALTLAMEIGDIKRFANARALASYAGIVPSVKSSGDKIHHGPIGKYGNKYIRWALAEAISHTIRKDKSYKLFYEKLAGKKGKPKARVAVMNKLIRAIYVMLTKRVPFKIKGSNMQKV